MVDLRTLCAALQRIGLADDLCGGRIGPAPLHPRTRCGQASVAVSRPQPAKRFGYRGRVQREHLQSASTRPQRNPNKIKL